MRQYPLDPDKTTTYIYSMYCKTFSAVPLFNPWTCFLLTAVIPEVQTGFWFYCFDG